MITRLRATRLRSSSWASASAATVASLSTNTGTPRRSPSTLRSGTPFSGMLVEAAISPVSKRTIDGTPMPTASYGRSAGGLPHDLRRAGRSARRRYRARSAAAWSDPCPSGPSSVAATLVPPTSIPTTVVIDARLLARRGSRRCPRRDLKAARPERPGYAAHRRQTPRQSGLPCSRLSPGPSPAWRG